MRFNASSASWPLVEHSTENPRSSRNRHTVCRISIESSTTNATSILRSETKYSPRRTLTKYNLPNKELRRKRNYLRHGQGRGMESLGFGAQFRLFDAHVFELAGFEDVAALHAFDVLGFLVARNDLHARMLARFHLGW